MDEPPSGTAGDEQDDPVSLFGTWPRIYTAALACLVAVMLFIAAFSRWPW